LACVAETKGKRTSKEADEKMEKATKLLGDYEREHLIQNKDLTKDKERENTFLKRMDGAKSKDQSRSAFLSGFKAASQSKVRLAPVVITHTNTNPKKDEDNFQDKTTFRVDFILQESLPRTDTNTEVVPRECRLVMVVFVI
jgi:hypothetical protein